MARERGVRVSRSCKGSTSTTLSGVATSLVVASAVNFIVDGFLLGVGFAVGTEAGILLMIAVAVENLFLGDGNAVDENPLAKIDQMGRRVASYAQPPRPQNRFSGGDDTPLPVGATHVQHRERSVRVAKTLEQRLHTLQPELPDAARAREERIDRGAVRSQGDVHPAAAGCPLMWRNS